MNTDRNLEDIAAKLDDMSVTLEEIKDKVHENPAAVPQQLQQIQNEVERTAEMIEGVVDPALPD